MKNKVLFTGIIITTLVAVLLSLTGCEKKEDVKEEKKEEKQQVVDETLVKINGLDFHLNKEATFKNIKYTIVGDFKEADHNHYIQYSYAQEDKSNLLFFRIFFYENQGTDTAIRDLGLDSGIALTDGKNDNVEYKYYAAPRTDGGTMHYYFINKDGSTYTLNFVSKYDIKDFEEKVVKSIKF